jgi:hypothetical protein|nr:MAG TPA: hypothetical protein [Caudoviricetes sp.]
MAEKKKIVRLADVGELENILKKDLAEEEAKGKDSDTLFCENVAGELTDLESLPTIDPERIIPAWRNPETDPPKVEEEVLIMYQTASGEFGITTAHYEDGTLLSQDSIFYWDELAAWGKLDEEHDDYIIPKGWWEYRHFNQDEVYNNRVDYPVMGWMPLPPKERRA